MTLKEKFENSDVLISRQKRVLLQIKISEDFTLSFVDWLMDNCTLSEDRTLYSYNSEDYTNEKLLKIYEKEKGL